MADLEWQQGIELFVDQQVFIDAVHGNEKVEEFSALTEVTTFEQRGEDLFLEGNILFTAYLEQPAAENVEHIQHRMPFDLRVPVGAQVAGMLSVSVKVSDAIMDVLGPGWIHLRAMVLIEGLSMIGGYVAHCGAQEAIVPAAPHIANLTDSMPSKSAVEQQGEHSPASPDGIQDGFAEFADPVASPLEFADLLHPFTAPEHHAKSGPETSPSVFSELGALAVRKEEEFEKESSLSAKGWKSQLEGADRALHGSFHPYKTGRVNKESTADLTSAMRQDDEEETDGSEGAALAQFHFEDVDIGPDDEAGLANEKLAKRIEELTADSTADSAAARSEWHDPILQPEPLVVPTPIPAQTPPTLDANLGLHITKVAVEHEIVDELSIPDREVSMKYTAMPEEVSELSAAEWFWKTLNIPTGENQFTMKFRIVQESETLDVIAAMYNTSPGELLRANAVAVETLRAGSLLYIPAH